MAPKTQQGEWRVRDGIEPIPGIGAGPLTDEEYERLEAAYMAPFLAADPEAHRPRDPITGDDGREVIAPVYLRETDTAPARRGASEFDTPGEPAKEE